ncbi:MAG: hypothetical protein FWC03_10775 [Treponema sp.]|nr:hypothetical protein [Treponema sp.]
MILKKIIAVFLLTAGIASNARGQAAEADYNKYQIIINTMLFNLSEIMENNRASDIVYETYVLADNAVRNNLVYARIDEDLETVLTGMTFNVYDTGGIFLSFGRSFLDTYSPESGIHYAILIHEYRHLHDYLKYGENYLIARHDEKEAYWYELDALRIEAEFIKHYLYGKYELSAFEAYVMYSLDNNNLNTASSLIFKESMDCFFYFHNLETGYLENRLSKENAINYLEQTGDGLIKAFLGEEDSFMAYMRFIEMSTYRKYLIKIFVTLMNNPAMTWGEVFEIYPETGRIYNYMSVIIDTERLNQARFLSSIYDFWEDDIMSRSRRGL